MPSKKEYTEVFNTDRPDFGGSGWNFNGIVPCERVASHGKEASIAVTIPPYGAVFFRGSGKLSAAKLRQVPKGGAKEPAKGAKKTESKKGAAAKSAPKKPEAKKSAAEPKKASGRKSGGAARGKTPASRNN